MTTPATYLASLPRGAYTVIRTNSRCRICQVNLHLDRLQRSFHSLFPLHAFPFQSICELFTDLEGDKNHPPFILAVVLVFVDETTQQQPRICCQRFPLPVFSPTVDRVLVGKTGTGPRSQVVSVKDSVWVLQRQHFESIRSVHHAQEYILTSHCGGLLEGLVSNLCVVVLASRRVFTAPQTVVLCGTMQTLCLQACEELGFEVVYEAPLWENRDQWTCAFLCNVTKPGQFIQQLVHEESGEVHVLKESDFSTQLQTRIQVLLEAEADSIPKNNIV